MAEVNTDIYKTLGQNNQQMSPLQILQLVGAANQNKLFNQTYDSREKIGQAWKNNVGPDGKINNPGLMRDVAGAGFLAPEATGQAISNSTNQFNLDATQLKAAQGILGSLAGKKDLSKTDVLSATTNLRNIGVQPEILSGILDNVYSAKNGDEMRKRLATHGIMSLGTGALEDAEGTPNAGGQIPKITRGQAIIENLNPGGRVVTNKPGFEAAANAAGAKAGESSTNALIAASDFQSNVTPLRKIIHILGDAEANGKQIQGIGTETSNAVKNIGVGLGFLDKNTTKPVEELRKYYTQNVLRNADIGAVDKMVAAFHGNPNIDLNDATARDLAATDYALKNMRQAQALEGSRVSKDEYPGWAAKFNSTQDPVAYGFDAMSADAQQKYLNSIKGDKTAKDRFYTSLGIAHRWKLLEKQNAEKPNG